jgi:micrococcal nuclease
MKPLLIRQLFTLILYVLFIFLPAHAAALRVIDGDTIVLQGETIRIANIDAPETRRAKCPHERNLGIKATNRIRQLLSGAQISLQRGDPVDGRLTDRYGRTLALVFVNGRDLGEILVAEGLAQLWYGNRRPWC